MTPTGPAWSTSRSITQPAGQWQLTSLSVRQRRAPAAAARPLCPGPARQQSPDVRRLAAYARACPANRARHSQAMPPALCPAPLSWTSIVKRSRSTSCVNSTAPAEAWRTTFVSASWKMRKTVVSVSGARPTSSALDTSWVLMPVCFWNLRGCQSIAAAKPISARRAGRLG